MLNSQSAITAARHYGTSGQAAHVDRRDGSSEQFTSTTAISEAEPTLSRTASTWQSVFWCFCEGFALYGASVHGLALTAVTAASPDPEPRRSEEIPARERRKSISLVSSSMRARLTVVEREDVIDRTAFERRQPSIRSSRDFAVHQVDRHRFVHPGWLSMIWRPIARWSAKRRREREIRKTVVTLAECDDRTLLDMGVPHRSQIEQMVRNGRNC